MDDRERCHATLYAMLLKSRGYSPERAAEAVARRYPGTRAELEARGLLATRKRLLASWLDPAVARAMKDVDLT